MFPGVSGSRPATSRAGMITIAAASGWWMPRAAPTAVAEARRPAVERASQAIEAERRRSARRPSARKASRRWDALLRRATIATPTATRDEPDGDQERPERHDAGGGAGDDERAEHDRAGGAEGGEGAAGRPEALSVREHAGEEADPDGVACAERARRC